MSDARRTYRIFDGFESILKLQTQHTHSFNRIECMRTRMPNIHYGAFHIENFEQKSYRTPTGGNSIGSAAVIHTHDACVQRCMTGRPATQTHE